MKTLKNFINEAIGVIRVPQGFLSPEGGCTWPWYDENIDEADKLAKKIKPNSISARELNDLFVGLWEMASRDADKVFPDVSKLLAKVGITDPDDQTFAAKVIKLTCRPTGGYPHQDCWKIIGSVPPGVNELEWISKRDYNKLLAKYKKECQLPSTNAMGMNGGKFFMFLGDIDNRAGKGYDVIMSDKAFEDHIIGDGDSGEMGAALYAAAGITAP